MLRAHDDVRDAARLAFLVVFHGDLGLAVGAEVRKRSVLPDFGEASRQAVGHRDRVRHVFGRLVRRVAEHHALVAGTDAVQFLIVHGIFAAAFHRAVHAHGDIRRLLVDRGEDPAGIAVEAVVGAVVADVQNDLPHDLRNVHVCLGGDLTHDNNKAGAREGLTCDPAHGILLQKGIQNGVSDLIAHFIRMPFCY